MVTQQDIVISVLGAGHAGHAVIGDLWLRGFRANLLDHPDFEKETLDPIRKLGGVKVVPAPGVKISLEHEGLAKINGKVTSSIKEALTDVDIVVLAVPSNAHRIYFELMLPHLEKGATVLINTGNWGALEFYGMLKKEGKDELVDVAETNSLWFAARRYNYMTDMSQPATVAISSVKKGVGVGVMPANKRDSVIEKLNKVWPQFYVMPDIVRSSAMNPNLRHVPIMLLNVGWLETTKGDYLFWKEGCSPHVAKIMKAVDDERMSVIRALGFKTVPIGYYDADPEEWQNIPENQSSTEYYESVQNLPFAPIARAGRIWDEGYGDRPFKYRYLEEDAAYLYVPIAGLGRVVKVPTPIIDALVNLACKINDIDYWRAGRNLEKLGVAGLSSKQIERYIISGKH